jgi:hypothetical protein
MLGQYARSRREREQMMKGVAASILIKSASNPDDAKKIPEIASDYDPEIGEKRTISCPDLISI